MKALKTIIATVVIVLTLTTVAMAGMQHVTKAQASHTAAPAPTVMRLAQLTSQQSGSHVGASQHTRTHERRVHRQHTAARLDDGHSSGQRSSGGQSGSHHYEPSSHSHASGNGHSGD